MHTISHQTIKIEEFNIGFKRKQNHSNNKKCFSIKMVGIKFFEPGKNAREEELRKYLKTKWKDKYGY